MFKKRCSNCDKKVEREFDFCPYCGKPQTNIKKDYGLLGRDDYSDPFFTPNAENFIKTPGIIDKLFGSAINSAMKMFEEELKNRNQEEKRLNNRPKQNLQLYINGKRIPLNESENQEEFLENEEENIRVIKKQPKIYPETLKSSMKLPRKEAKTTLKRFKDRVVYELETPGINSLNNVVVNKLENSIEIKIYTEKTVYIKTLAISLPLLSYSIKQDKVLVEFKS